MLEFIVLNGHNVVAGTIAVGIGIYVGVFLYLLWERRQK